MQAWDRDLLKSNDLICQWQLDITEMVKDSRITKGPINLQKLYYSESFKQRIWQEGQEEPLKFVASSSDASPGSLGSTFTLTAYHPEDIEKKKPILVYMDLKVVPVEYSLMN